MEIPLSIVLLLLFGVMFLTCTTMACGATTCTSCTTTVQTTCPTMQAPCRPNAACPAGFTTVANGNSNKCYLVGSADVANLAAASVACAGTGGLLFEPETALELDAVRAIIPSVTPSYEYYIGFTDIGNAASNPVGFYSGIGLPANGIPYPLFSPTALDCIAVRKTGGYTAVSRCVGTARVLCETRLDKTNCVCP